MTVDLNLESSVDDLSAQYNNPANRFEQEYWWDGGNWRTSARWYNTGTIVQNTSGIYPFSASEPKDTKLIWYTGEQIRNQQRRISRWVTITLSETWSFTLSSTDASTQQFDYDEDRNEYFNLFASTTGSNPMISDNSSRGYRLRTGGNDDPRWTIPNPGNTLTATWRNGQTRTNNGTENLISETYPSSATGTVIWYRSSSNTYRPYQEVDGSTKTYWFAVSFESKLAEREAAGTISLGTYSVHNYDTVVLNPTAPDPTAPDYPLSLISL